MATEQGRIRALIAEAIVDAYDEEEQRTGFFTMLEEQLAVPFDTEILGVHVTVERIDLTMISRSSHSAPGAVCVSESRFSTCPCRGLRLPVPNGSRRIVRGYVADDVT